MLKQFQLFAGLILSAVSGLACASQPVAIIEDINTAAGNYEVMDFVSPGQVINLGKSGKVVLGYMKPCIQETITGGTVTIKKDHSMVEGGQLIREDVQCSGAQTQIDGQVAGKSGAMAFRGTHVGLAQPDTVIMGTSPVFIFDKPASHITITRMDRKGEIYRLPVNARYLDTSKKRLHLHRTGVYKVETADEHEKTFRIDSKASDHPVAIFNRMVRLP